MPDQFGEFPTAALKIDQPKLITFSLNQFGLYSLSITARCERNQDLRVIIDEFEPTEIPQLKNVQHFRIPPTWNGTELNGLAKTVVFILPLNQYQHTLNFIPQKGATIERIEIKPCNDTQNILFMLEQQAESGKGRPWVTFALINLPLRAVVAEASVSWHFWNGDDVKLIIDNQIEPDPSSKKMKNWIWSARFWQILTGAKREQKNFTKNLPVGIHYLEFWADQTPILHQVSLDLGGVQLKRIPTVNDPEWTGDFADDTNQIILTRALFGEARNTLIPDEARVAIAWVIRNRVESKKWPSTYWQVITQKWQFSSFNLLDQNRAFVENPLKSGKEIDRQAWEHAYQIAKKIVGDELKDPTKGANQYYDDSIQPPPWTKGENSVFTVTYKSQAGKNRNIFFYRL